MKEKKINFIGEKEIYVKSFNKNHIKITVMLTILADGKSLRSFVVFNGKPKYPKKSKLRNHPKVLSGFLYVCC